MRLAHFTALAAAILFGPSAFGQTSALNQIEHRLLSLRGAAAPAEPAAPPPVGYLGFEPDEESDIGQGVRVKTVKPGAPAAKSGLKDRDLIISVDGKTVTGLAQFDPILDRTVPGQKVDMIVIRDGRRVPLTVTLGNWPASAAATDTDAPPPLPPGAPPAGAPTLNPPTGSPAPSVLPAPASEAGRGPGIVAQPQEPRTPAIDLPSPNPLPSGTGGSGGASLGITVAPPGEQPRGGTRRRGAYVAGVKLGSPAEQAGLKAGNVIVQMDARRIDSDDDLVAAIRAARAGQEVELRYYDGDRLESKPVRLAAAGSAAAPAAPSAAPTPAPSPGLGGILGGSILPGRTEGTPGSLGAGGSRPLLSRVERAVDGLSRATQGGGGPVLPIPSQYDPQVMASLQKSVADLAAAVSSLEERIKSLEGRPGGATSTSPPGPGFGAPNP